MSIAVLADITGIIGVGFILIAYFLLQTQLVDTKKFLYSFINLIGAMLILLSLFIHWNLPSVIIEVFWILISLYGMFRALMSRKRD